MVLGFRPALCGEFYVVGIETQCKSADTGTDADLNVVIFGGTNKIFTADVTVAATKTTSTNTVEVTNNYYQFNTDTALDISVDKNGNGDSYDADLIIHFVRA